MSEPESSGLEQWIRSLHLPEPELDYPLDGQTLSVAFPDDFLGILKSDRTELIETPQWRLWHCRTSDDVRNALKAIAELTGVMPAPRELSLDHIHALVESGLLEQALERVEECLGAIDLSHPQYKSLKALRREIRTAIRSAGQSRDEPTGTGRSLEAFLQPDVQLISTDLPDHNVLGFYDSSPAVVEQIDAVWAFRMVSGSHELWVATAVGHPAATFDPSIRLESTERELLHALLDQLQTRITFVWDRPRMLRMLEVWHFRSTGIPFPNSSKVVDLRALCLVAFPSARRTDTPEMLCHELKLFSHDANATRGPLAAMLALIARVQQVLADLDPRLRAALGALFRRGHLAEQWIDALVLQTSATDDFNGYSQLLESHYDRLPAPVQSSAGTRDSRGLELESFFETGGYLAQARGGDYSAREGQIRFAERVGEALLDKSPYVLEAGTGVGKTTGYLVPLLLSGKTSFVATYTKNLQDQAWVSDVPIVLRALSTAGIARTVGILKGKSNYVSPHLIEAYLDDLPAILHGRDDLAYAFAAVLHWAVETTTGYLDELEALGQPELIQVLSRAHGGPSSSAAGNSRDPYTRAVNAVEGADLVLVNHSLVFSLADPGQPRAIRGNAIVFDEAHNLEASATEALTRDFDGWGLLREVESLIGRDRSGRVSGLLEILLAVRTGTLEPAVLEFRSALADAEGRLRLWCDSSAQRILELRKQQADADDTAFVFNLDSFWTPDLRTLAGTLDTSLAELADRLESLIDFAPSIRRIPHRLQTRIAISLSSLLEHVRSNSNALAALLDAVEDQVHWGEADGFEWNDDQRASDSTDHQMRCILHVTPIDVSAWLRATIPVLFEHQLYVSATLSIGGDFRSILRRIGVDSEGAVTAILPSPFDLRQQALLAVPTDLPTPQTLDDSLYIEALSGLIAELVRISNGYALVLFTSRRSMSEVKLRLQSALDKSGITVLAQSSQNRTALVERFRAAKHTGEKLVLLGLRSFWEGVDFPGVLKILVISRLPFDFFGHPVAAARRANYLSHRLDGDYFRDVIVPATLLHLRQMVGRLIRREDDRGVCVIADSRIEARDYGRYMLRQLLDSQSAIGRRTKVLEGVRTFLLDPDQHQDVFDLDEVPEEPQELSPEQQAIVESPARRMVVAATAGSGKTRTLVQRICRLVTSGQAKPDQILVLTYTNRARDVMQQRLDKALDTDLGWQLSQNVLTYHRLAARIIQSENPSGFNFLNEDAEQQLELLSNARSQVQLTTEELSDEDALSAISFAQNGLVDEAELETGLTESDPFLERLAALYLSYVNQLRAKNALDYGEAIVQAVRTLRENPAVVQKWSAGFKWVFCDEYQDTTPAQAAMVGLIGQNANILVVGDSAQSIYSWQGADPDNLKRFDDDFPDTAHFSLTKNYRCFPNLVRTAEHFLRHTGQLAGSRIRHDERRDQETQRVSFMRSPTVQVESQAAVAMAQAVLLEEPDHSFAILARKWSLLEDIERECIRRQVPYRFASESARGIAADVAVKRAIDRACQLWLESRMNRVLGDTRDSAVIRDLQTGTINDAAELLRRAATALGYPRPAADSEKRFNQLEGLLVGLPPSALESLYGTAVAEQSLVLSTIHGQKGEEFDSVVVIGLEVNHLPNKPPRRQDSMLEWRRFVQAHSRATWRASVLRSDLQRAFEQEEERLFYVALTRAKYQLVISSCETRGVESPFVASAQMPGATTNVLRTTEVTLPRGTEGTATEYHSDGRTFRTISGIHVRSKSEALLANEFSRRGMYFEYELPNPSVLDALPDFTFPDYGGLILEHLGLLGDAEYQRRWEAKANRYRAKGLKFFFTTEERIRNLRATVDELQEQFRLSVTDKLSREVIDLVEQLRTRAPLLAGVGIS